ncbi:MAG: hypothetical protein HYS27_26830 [Deltaproteobacteria bacterium]|nr:hypothetical protein [Deltaproteobacteria bacterium]
MRTLDIDWADLEIAFRDASGAKSWLDMETGEVVTLVPGFDDEADLQGKLRTFPARFAALRPVDKQFTQRVLQSFIAASGGALKGKLGDAAAGPGGLARAIALLKDDRTAWARFARLEQQALMAHIERFLEEQGIKAGSRAPAPDLFEGLA